jgi:hypothetical protein
VLGSSRALPWIFLGGGARTLVPASDQGTDIYPRARSDATCGNLRRVDALARDYECHPIRLQFGDDLCQMDVERTLGMWIVLLATVQRWHADRCEKLHERFAPAFW